MIILQKFFLASNVYEKRKASLNQRKKRIYFKYEYISPGFNGKIQT